MELDIEDLIKGHKPQNDIESDEILTEFNSLYVTKDTMTFHLPVPDPLLEILGMEEVPVHVDTDKYTLYYAEFGHENAEQDAVLEKLRRAKPLSELHIRIDSPGGGIFEGFKLYNIIKEKFNGASVGYIDGSAYSMGAFLFGVCDQRIVYETSSIMFHDFSALEYGKGGEMRDSLQHISKLTYNMFRKVFVKSGMLTENEFKRMVDDSKQWWMDAEEMCLRGIATHVIVDGNELSAEQYIDYLESELDIEDYLDILEQLNEAEDAED